MAYSVANYTGDGVTTNFAFSFPYLDESHVIVTVDGVVTSFTFLTANMAQVIPAPAVDSAVVVYRDSSRGTPLVDFQDAAVLTEAALELANKQALYVAQEAFDNSDLATVTQQVSDWAGAAQAAAAAAAASALSAASSATTAGAAATTAVSAAASVGTAVTDAQTAATAAAASAAAAAATLASSLLKANNLSDLTNAGTARTNLGLGTMAVATATDYVRKATAETITAKHTFERSTAVGSLGADAHRFAEFYNSNGNTDGKRWAWIAQKSGADDYLSLSILQDDGDYVNDVIRFKRTGDVRQSLDLATRLTMGVADDGSTDIQAATIRALSAITTLTLDATGGVVVANRFLSDGVQDLGNKTGSITIDLGAISDYTKMKLTGNVSVTFTLPTLPCVKRLIVEQDATPRTWTNVTTVGFDKGLDAAQKTIGTTASKFNTFIVMYDGTRLTGNWIREHA